MKLSEVLTFASVAVILFGQALATQTVAQHPVTDSEKMAFLQALFR